MSDLIEKLARNARFYEHEAVALKEDETRRDNRNLGWREAKAIADLLTEAMGELTNED